MDNQNKQKPKVVCIKCGATISKQYLKQHQKRDICIKKSEFILLDE